MKPKQILRALTPPIVWRTASWLKAGRRPPARTFEGPFPSWQAAVARSDGWDSLTITDKTLVAARHVRDGVVAAEQDGVASDTIPYSPTVLAFLGLVLARHETLDIVDFGGGLGTNYFHTRKLLLGMPLPVRWNVVERPALVTLGVAEFQTEQLRFHATLKSVSAPRGGLIFTGSLQYVESPTTLLDEVAREGLDVVAFDRLLVSPSDVDGAYVQHPDRTVYYDATYPVWCFSRGRLVDGMIRRGWSLVETFPQGADAEFSYCGMVFVRGGGASAA